MGVLSFGLPNKKKYITALDVDLAYFCSDNHLSKGVSPVEEAMAAVAPGVALDLSVNRESKAFIGSILDAEVRSRHDFPLQHLKHRK